MKKRVLLLTIVCMLLLLSPCAMGQVSMEAAVGYNQTTLNGRWFPLEVQMKNDGQAFDGAVSVDLMQTQDEYDRYEYPVHLDAGEEKTVRFPISTLVSQRIFSICLNQGGEKIAQVITSAEAAVEDSALLIGVLGADDAFAEGLCIGARNDILNRGEIIDAICLDEDLAKMSGKELDAFEMLVIAQLDDGLLASETKAQLDAWVQNGGILLCGAMADHPWLRERSGVTYRESMESEDLIRSLLAYVGAASVDQETRTQIRPIANEEMGLVYDGYGHCLMAQTQYGNGYILTLGFDIRDEQVFAQLKDHALLQRLLIASETIPYEDLFVSNHRANYRYGSSLNEAQVVGIGVSIWPVAVVLCGYVLLAGIVLFVLLRKQDQSTLLWIALPAAAIAGFAVMVCLAGMLDLDAPTSASFHVTHYDENGVVSSEERALVAYPDQNPVRIHAENDVSVERMEYGYFYGNAEADIKTRLRDTITLGERPSLQLSAVAPWLSRNLVVRNEQIPSGSVAGTVWMEADGLHAQIVNSTELELKNASLLTSLGYVQIGDIGAGETLETCIVRPETTTKNTEGDQAILNGELLEYPVSLSSINWAKVYPQMQTDESFEADENGAYHAQWIERLKLNLAYGGSSQTFECVLYAETPQIACAPLYQDGKLIQRTAQESVLSAKLRLLNTGKTGVFYCPQGTFTAHDVVFSGNDPQLGKETEKRYADLGEDIAYGFDLSYIPYDGVTSIKIVSDYYKPERAALSLQVYDFAAKDWVSLHESKRAELDSTLTGRVISAEGHMFIRYTSPDGDACTVYLPKIIVEGSV